MSGDDGNAYTPGEVNNAATLATASVDTVERGSVIGCERAPYFVDSTTPTLYIETIHHVGRDFFAHPLPGGVLYKRRRISPSHRA